MASNSFTKDPNSRLDYSRDWTKWLADSLDTIVTSTWIVPEGLDGTDESHTDSTATIWLAGGTEGSQYKVTNRIVTAGGRTDDRTFTVTIRQK